MAGPVQTVCLCEKALLLTVITTKVERRAVSGEVLWEGMGCQGAWP